MDTLTIETRVCQFLWGTGLHHKQPQGVPWLNFLKTHLDMLGDGLEHRVQCRQETQWKNHDQTGYTHMFLFGDNVFTHSATAGAHHITWLPGSITAVTGSLSYEVLLTDGRVLKCHVDQIRARYCAAPVVASALDDLPLRLPPSQSVTPPSENLSPATDTVPEAIPPTLPMSLPPVEETLPVKKVPATASRDASAPATPMLRRSASPSKKPEWINWGIGYRLIRGLFVAKWLLF